VFELLQNADDNVYSRARETGAMPYISFQVYPDRIVIDCNEDGFTTANLSAICSVGKSSKTEAQGYIGEKGIGFKSVFMVAWKVHILSGAFSFSFTHKPGDSGMGMISPVWEDKGEELLESPLTRIILHLNISGDSEALAKTRQSIEKQFEDLQETFLLFMRNLRIVYVSFYDEKGERVSSATYSSEKPRANYAVLRRTKVANDTAENEVMHFHVTTYEATNLARNDNRTYSQSEESNRTYAKSNVVLAFPLSESLVPIIKPQHLFVFLPVRRVGFNFLIQADFVTDANRQDIVQDSLRNIDLLDGIAEAFIKAVLQFCEHDTLRYQWVRYLPDLNATNLGTLWISLANKIASLLKRTPVAFGRKRPHRRLIRDLCHPTHDLLDEHGDPLFDDGDPEQMISQFYTRLDRTHLRQYGLKNSSLSHVINWLRKELRNPGIHRLPKSFAVRLGTIWLQ
jgi:hypothetical protein